MPDLPAVLRVYVGSDGSATSKLYAELDQLGDVGKVAVNLFRACKASERAKVYRGGRYKGAAYDKKDWSIDNLCKALVSSPESGIVRWGWGIDSTLRTKGSPHHHVLYVDLPTGQVSFHNGRRAAGPDYPGEWDGVPGVQVDRICRWITLLFDPGSPASPDAMPPGAEPVDTPCRQPEDDAGRRAASDLPWEETI